jgi:hypothetical protein
MGEWPYSCTFIDFNTGWKDVVSFTAWALYPLGKSS